MQGLAIPPKIHQHNKNFKATVRKTGHTEKSTPINQALRHAEKEIPREQPVIAPTAAPEEDIMQELCDYLHELHDDNPKIRFKIAALDETSQIEDFAAAAEGSLYLVLDPAFLKSMLTDKAAFIHGKKQINKALKHLYAAADKQADTQNNANVTAGVVIQADGKALLCTTQTSPPNQEDETLKKFFDLMKNGGIVHTYKEAGGRNVTEIRTPKGTYRFSIVKRANYASGNDLKRLAQTDNIGSIRALISGMSARLNQIRFDKSLDKNEVKAAVAKLKNVMAQAGVKIKHLNQERLLKPSRHKIHPQNPLEIAKVNIDIVRLKELQRRRKMRRIREYGASAAALPEFLLRQYRRRTERADEQYGFASDALTPSQENYCSAPADANPVPAAASGSVTITSINIEV